MIALYRRRNLTEACWLRSPEKLEELIAIAQPGDTLHNISHEIAVAPEKVLSAVQWQRQRKECKQL